MKFASVLLLFGISPLSSALDKPAGRVRSVKSADNRKLNFFGIFGTEQYLCETQLQACQAASIVSELPYAEWVQALEQFESETGIYAQLKDVIEELRLFDPTAVEDGVKLSVEAAAVAAVNAQAYILELDALVSQAQQEAQARPQTTAALVQQTVDPTIAQQVEMIVFLLIDIVEPLLGLDLQWSRDLVTVGLNIMAASDQGPDALFEVVLSSAVTYLIPLANDVLLGGGLDGIFDALTGGGGEVDQDGEDWPEPASDTSGGNQKQEKQKKEKLKIGVCHNALSECRFGQMVAEVVPNLMGLAFEAEMTAALKSP